MTLYRMGCIMLVISTWCLAVSVSAGSDFHMLISIVCVLLAGQIYAQGREQEQASR